MVTSRADVFINDGQVHEPAVRRLMWATLPQFRAAG